MSPLARAFGNVIPDAPPALYDSKDLVGGRHGHLPQIPDYFASQSSPCVRTISAHSQKISYSQVPEKTGLHLL